MASLKTDFNSMPLKGTVIRYEEPLEPATTPEDWQVQRVIKPRKTKLSEV